MTVLRSGTRWGRWAADGRRGDRRWRLTEPLTGQNSSAARVGGLPDIAAADAALARLSTFASGKRRLRLLTGGLTNRNFQVTVNDGTRYVARFSSPKSALLAIDRAAEYQNSRSAAAA